MVSNELDRYKAPLFRPVRLLMAAGGAICRLAKLVLTCSRLTAYIKVRTLDDRDIGWAGSKGIADISGVMLLWPRRQTHSSAGFGVWLGLVA